MNETDGWRTSTYCGELSYCVEVRCVDLVWVRDTKGPLQGSVSVTHDAWRSFLSLVR